MNGGMVHSAVITVELYSPYSETCEPRKYLHRALEQ